MIGTRAPLVDMIIAIHDVRRPLERAIRSVLPEDGVRPDWLRVTIVCHNISANEIAARLPSDVVTSVRFRELFDGIHSAAGPFSHGIEQSEAEYLSIMGSDDHLEPGALSAWLDFARRHRLTAVIPPQRHARGQKVRTPPLRPFRTKSLHPVRDRLVYRTAPLGLMKRSAVDRLALAFALGVPTGEDQLFSAKLWFSGEAIGYARGAPAYVVGDDAPERTTLTHRSLQEEFRFIDELIVDPWFATLTERERRAVVTKLVRVHLFGAASRLSKDHAWTESDRTFLSGLISRLTRRSARFMKPLAIADRLLLDALMNEDISLKRIEELSLARRRFGRPPTLLTRDPRWLFAADAPLRFMAASALV